jgi:hypothetical protein
MTSIMRGCSGIGVDVGVGVGVGVGVSVGVGDRVGVGGIGVGLGIGVDVAVGTAGSGDSVGENGAPPQADRATARTSRVIRPKIALRGLPNPRFGAGPGNREKRA